jgi:pimeloyl-ACP methyl ester carboxylesterase
MPQLTRPEGHRIHYECSGPVRRGATVLVFHHGTPGAALLWDSLVGAALEFGWRVLMLSRPGYAMSARMPGRSVADAAWDVEAVLDHLGAGSFVAAGWSGGGPHALACGALLAPRCAAVATIAGVAPYYGVTDLEWTAGMGPENVEEFKALQAGDPEVEGRIADLVGSLTDIQPQQLVGALGGLLSDPDRAVVEGDFGEFFAAWFRLFASVGWHRHVSLFSRYIDDIVARLAFDSGES